MADPSVKDADAPEEAEVTAQDADDPGNDRSDPPVPAEAPAEGESAAGADGLADASEGPPEMGAPPSEWDAPAHPHADEVAGTAPEAGPGEAIAPSGPADGPGGPAPETPATVEAAHAPNEEELREQERVRIAELLEGLTGDDIEELKRKRRKAEKEMVRFMDKRNALNQEAKRWSSLRDEYNAKVRDLLQKASTHKAKRDETNRQVRESKEQRHTYNTMVKDLDHEIRDLKRTLLPKDADSLARLKREQRGLEFRQMTSVMSQEKERELVSQLADVTARIREIENVVEQNQEIRDKKKGLSDAKVKAEEAHARVSHLADVAQAEHDAMIELYSKIDEMRGVADNAQEKFVEAKTQADEAHAMYVTFLQQMKDYEKMIAGLWRREREDRRRTDAEEEEAKVDEVFEKLKSGEKLSTEDLLLLQKSG